MIRSILYIIVIIVSISFVFSYVQPAYYRVDTKRSFLASLNNPSSSVDTVKMLIKQTTEEILKIDPINLQKFNVFLPETIDKVRFMNNLSHVGALNGIVLEDMHIEEKTASSPEEPLKKNLVSLPAFLSPSASGVSTPGVSGGKYATTRARFSFTSSYKAALAFLGDIEKSLGLINVTSLSFSPQEEKSGAKAGFAEVHYRYTLEVETYSLR